ncbi:hypothetical protein [Streptomyces sp. NPDC021622]|uniref:hypothetical protein n=1 Tax=Streptomyces sp. NPDC021622 TaxID=3155013 RepID=UPI00340642BC
MQTNTGRHRLVIWGRSKGIGVNADGTSGSVTYEDALVPTDRGWRISHRKVAAR